MNHRWRSLLLWTLVATSHLAAAATSRNQHRHGLDEHLRPLGFVGVDLKSGPAQELLVESALDDTKVRLLVAPCSLLTTVDDRVLARQRRPADPQQKVLVDPILGFVVMTNFVVVERMELGKAAFARQPVKGGFKRRGNQTSGALGLDFLLRHHALLDCLDKRLYVRGKALEEEELKALEGALSSSRHIPVACIVGPPHCLAVQASSGGVNFRLRLDTAMGFTVLDNDLVRQLGLRPTLSSNIAFADSGTMQQRSIGAVQLDQLSLGDLTLHKVRVGVSELQKFEMGAAGADNDRVQGVLGNEWLARAGALIHFQSLKCWLFRDSNREANSPVPAKSVPTRE